MSGARRRVAELAQEIPHAVVIGGGDCRRDELGPKAACEKVSEAAARVAAHDRHSGTGQSLTLHCHVPLASNGI